MHTYSVTRSVPRTLCRNVMNKDIVIALVNFYNVECGTGKHKVQFQICVKFKPDSTRKKNIPLKINEKILK